MSGNRNLSIVVSFIGEVARKASCNEVGFHQVHDLVDVIHRVERAFPFLRSSDYNINVNARQVKRNLRLSSGDKVEICFGDSIN